MSSASSQAISGNINYGDDGKSNLMVWGIVAAAVLVVVWILNRKK